jgi:hexosaminidase
MPPSAMKDTGCRVAENNRCKSQCSGRLFYGVQTLLQLFPKEIESASMMTGVQWTAPAVEITDYPRFGWRG